MCNKYLLYILYIYLFLYFLRMPEIIKELMAKYKDNKFTIDIYEKYKIYKSNTKFTKINI